MKDFLDGVQRMSEKELQKQNILSNLLQTRKRGTFEGEEQATKELLAYENRIKSEEITVKTEIRQQEIMILSGEKQL